LFKNVPFLSIATVTIYGTLCLYSGIGVSRKKSIRSVNRNNQGGNVRSYRWLLASLLILFTCSLLAIPWAGKSSSVYADSGTPEPTAIPTADPQKRQTVLTIDVDQYVWWMSRYSNNNLECTILVEHEGTPTATEVYDACGQKLYQAWVDTQSCDSANVTECTGVYLSLEGSGRTQRDMVVDLAPAEAWLSVRGCSLKSNNQCDRIPDLIITGLEPLPNESIIRVEGVFDGMSFGCPGGECALPLKITGTKGVSLEFWGVSSFGDTTPVYTAMVRVLPWGDFMNPESKDSTRSLFYVDVLSSQWRGMRAASCAETWQVFPDVGETPHWLQTPNDANELASSESFYLLAGMLIRNGDVDASTCPSGGLGDGMAANECGLDSSEQQIKQWQNQFDNDIFSVSRDTGVPAYLMKNIFERESQFWPGIYKTLNESGLGQMTDNGADTILLWNTSFYAQFCPFVLSKDTCAKSFNQLDSESQRMLRGALVVKVNADCADCVQGIDLTKANFSINVFAKTLLANCDQTGQIIYNVTEHMPGSLTTYGDLWRFTLVNYNGGAGCLSNAITMTWNAGEELTWDDVSGHFDEACQGSIKYVENVTEMQKAQPTPTPWQLLPTATPPPESTPQPDPNSFRG
jgi:hypothetical protein